jgi:hypothetical protein
LQTFAEAVRRRLDAVSAGEPEDQLRGPVERLFAAIAQVENRTITTVGEARIRRLGRPDYAIEADGLLAGHLELKAPGSGADPEAFRSRHDKDQWERFKALPNLIYSDGNAWTLFRGGVRAGSFALSGDLRIRGRRAVAPEDAEAFLHFIRLFLAWEPAPLPPKPTPQDVADLLAPLCRLLRDEVAEAVAHPDSRLIAVASDWRQLLFPDADDRRFADAYAQTVTFALLLAHAEGASTLTLEQPIRALASEHALLSRALAALTVSEAREEIAPALATLQRVIDRIPAEAMSRARDHDPWLYFYEDFLAAYDPELRKNTGVYYTPVEVVRAQVRLIDRLLVNRLARPFGFADAGVVTLDPAVGTGTYLLGVIDHALGRVHHEEGAGAVAARASDLADRLHGFEIMVGPYAVAQLRVSRALAEHGAELPEGPGVRLTDTLESPFTEPQRVMAWYRLLSEEHERALHVKREVPVLVCLGNPPYDRHEAAAEGNLARTGGWVRYGDDLDPNETRGLDWRAIQRRREERSILYQAFASPAMTAGHGGDVKNLYNLYVYFWRWALWKVFEHETAAGPGVVSFISASSYLDGDAFVGMREHMRRICDEVWIIDLGGEGRGTRQEENVFAIRTPVAIAICARYGQADRETPATVHYTRLAGDRAHKLERLDAVADFDDLPWEDCPTDWHAPLRPAGTGPYFTWPQLIDLMPWQHSGVQMKRTWPIAPDTETLARRWRALLRADDRAFAFAESDRLISQTYAPIPPKEERDRPIAELGDRGQPPRLERYAYRSFDVQHAYIDGRIASRPRSDLWRAHSDRQVYLTTLFSYPLGAGPALTAASHVPDLDHFRGSAGAKATIPLYRDAAAEHPNIAPGLLELLSETFGRPVTPEDFAAYVYAVLAHPGFTERFWTQLESRDLRVPLTKDAALFAEAVQIGSRLLWLHTFGERFTSRDRPRGRTPRGRARSTRPVPDHPNHYPETFNWLEGPEGEGTLIVGEGAFAPVPREVYEFEVSGLKVVQSWLNYRMKRPRHARKSSPLDDIRPERWSPEFTTELLRVLWILEATVETYPHQAGLLDRIVEGRLHEQPVAQGRTARDR